MANETAVARANERSRRDVLVTIAVILTLPVTIPILFVLLIIGWYQVAQYIPMSSARAQVSGPAATVIATAYWDGGRYLDIRVGGRRFVRRLPRPRNIFTLRSAEWFDTCIYRTADQKIAFNMWRYVEVIGGEAERADDPDMALQDATYLGVFTTGAAEGEIVFKAADPPRPAALHESRSAC